jgi:hypothetical protein
VRFTICDSPQRSPEWFAARLGKLTGSCAGAMLSKIKSGEAAARRDLRLKLVCERLTGQCQDDGFVNDAMQRGIDLEPQAFAAYEAHTGQMVTRTGFLALNGVEAGCSLDGHVGNFDGIVEIKCPKSATHLRYLRSGEVPAEHLPQIRHNLWISGAAWCDFVSFDDRFPPAYQVFIVRVERNEQEMGIYEGRALAFLSEVDNELTAIQTMADIGGQLARMAVA